MKKIFLLAVGICLALSSCKPPVSSDKEGLPQCKPEPQAVFGALGIRSWQFDLTIPQGKPYGLAIYSKAEHKEPIPVNGIMIFNHQKGSPHVEKITVTIALQTLSSSKGETRYLLGLNSSYGGSWTREVESSLPAWFVATDNLKIDEKGRVLLAFDSDGCGVISGLPIDDYSSSIYLQLAPYESK